MWTATHHMTYMCLGALFWTGVVASNVKTRFFTRLESMDGYLGTNSYLETSAGSLAVCSMACMMEDSCWSLVFNEDDGQCSLFQSQVPQTGSPKAGTVTYQKFWVRCPDDWGWLHENSCITVPAELLSWTDALQKCQSYGGSLVSLQTASKIARLREYFTEYGITSTETWLGGTDSSSEGDWRWVATGEAATIPWTGIEPNGGSGEDCLALWGHSKRFNDASCSSPFRFVCEIIVHTVDI